MEDGHFNLAFEESVPQGGGTSDFNALINRPKYNGALMTSNTNIPAVPTKTSDLTNDSDFVNQAALDVLEQELQGEIAEKQDRLTAGANITIVNNVISATGGGTGDYDDLDNKPSIEGITLEGNKTAAQLGLATATALAAEIGAREGADEVIEGNIETLNTAVSEHDTSIQNLENDVDALQTDVETLEGEVSGIEDVIPSQASISNQLADKAFVNSTVQTGTANFRGNWANWAAVPIDATEYPADYTGETTPSTNDYMVVQDASGYVDPTETLVGTWRFKYTGVWATDGRNGWQPEYQVNETPLTAAQLAALNSGATTALIEQITRNEDAISALDADKQDLLTAGDNITISNNEISADVPELLTTTGQSETAGMTQKAITDAIDGKLEIPTITISPAQVISMTPLTVQFTAEQDAIITSNVFVSMDATQLGMGIITFQVSNGGDDLWGLLSFGTSNLGDVDYYSISYDHSTMLGELFNEELARYGYVDYVEKELDARIQANPGAPTTSTAASMVGQLYEDIINGKLYQCTDISGDTYTWEEVGGGGGGDPVYSTVQTSNSATGGAVYIGARNASNQIIPDPSTTDNHRAYFWALPWDATGSGAAAKEAPSDQSINIGGYQRSYNSNCTTIGYRSSVDGDGNTCFGWQTGGSATASYCTFIGANAKVAAGANYQTALGYDTTVGAKSSVALGAKSTTSVQGEVSIGGSNLGTDGYKNTQYRKITNVYDGENAHDALTVGQANALIDAINSAMNTSIPHIGAGA